MRRNTRIACLIVYLAWLTPALLTLLPGCVAPSAHREDAEAGIWRRLPAGEVIGVNYEDGYVILQCIDLPSTGQLLKVYHGRLPVAEVAVTEVGEQGCVAADILRGTPARGDLVRNP